MSNLHFGGFHSYIREFSRYLAIFSVCKIYSWKKYRCTSPVPRILSQTKRITHVRIQRIEVQGVRTSLWKITELLGPLAIPARNPWKTTNYQLSRHSVLGLHKLANETPFKWRFVGGPMMACFLWYLDPTPLHQNKGVKKRFQGWVGSLWQNRLDPRM